MERRRNTGRVDFHDLKKTLSAISDGGEFLSRMTDLINCRNLDQRWALPVEIRMFLALYELDIETEVDGIQGWFERKVESVGDVLRFLTLIEISKKHDLLVAANAMLESGQNSDDQLERKLAALSKTWRESEESIGLSAKKWFFENIDSIKENLLICLETGNKSGWELSPDEIMNLAFNYVDGAFSGKTANFIGIDRLELVVSLMCDQRCQAQDFLSKMALGTSAGIAMDLLSGRKTDYLKAQAIIVKYENTFSPALIQWKIESEKMWSNPDPVRLMAYMSAVGE